MAIEIKKGEQQQSMARRLLAMAGPIVGGMMGGPAGAAIGGVLGGKIGGASTQDALLNGAQAGFSYKPGESGGTNVTESGGGNAAGGMVDKLAGAADSPFSRRLAAKSQDPGVAIDQGLGVLEQLPGSHPLKQELAPMFLQAKFKRK